MEQKYVVIVFVAVLLIGLAAAGINLFNQNMGNNDKPNDQARSFTPSVATQNIPSPTISTPSSTIKIYSKFPGVLPEAQLINKKVVISTNKGEIEFEIDASSPKAASNFIFLANDGFYNNLTFHRVVKGFVIQGGDPQGDGRGGPGYKFEDEPVTKPYLRGTVAMANAGPNTNGSQFFIVLEDQQSLPPNYTIFGQVTKGMEVVDQINIGDVMQKVTIEPAK